MIKSCREKMFPDEEPEFQVAPMIDILLVLMTFFMSITSTEILKTRTKLQLDLAVAKESKAQDKTASQAITDIISRSKSRGDAARFFRALIRVGENVPYWFSQQILMACAAGDVDNITFSVLSKEDTKSYGSSSNKP